MFLMSFVLFGLSWIEVSVFVGVRTKPFRIAIEVLKGDRFPYHAALDNIALEKCFPSKKRFWTLLLSSLKETSDVIVSSSYLKNWLQIFFLVDDTKHNVCSEVGRLQCEPGVCVDHTRVCDITKNCKNGADETQRCCKCLVFWLDEGEFKMSRDVIEKSLHLSPVCTLISTAKVGCWHGKKHDWEVATSV